MERGQIFTNMVLSAKKTKSKRADLFLMISDCMRDKIYESALESDHVWWEFEFPSGWIEVSIHRNGFVEVSVVHCNEHESPTLEKAIADSLPDWSDVEAEAYESMRKEQEFRDYLWRNCRHW